MHGCGFLSEAIPIFRGCRHQSSSDNKKGWCKSTDEGYLVVGSRTSSNEHTSRLLIRPMMRFWSFEKSVPSRRSISVVGNHQGVDKVTKVCACWLTTFQKEIVSRNLSWHLKVRLLRLVPCVSWAMKSMTLMSESKDREAPTSKCSREGRAFMEHSYGCVNTRHVSDVVPTSSTPVSIRDKLFRWCEFSNSFTEELDLSRSWEQLRSSSWRFRRRTRGPNSPVAPT